MVCSLAITSSNHKQQLQARTRTHRSPASTAFASAADSSLSSIVETHPRRSESIVKYLRSFAVTSRPYTLFSSMRASSASVSAAFTLPRPAISIVLSRAVNHALERRVILGVALLPFYARRALRACVHCALTFSQCHSVTVSEVSPVSEVSRQPCAPHTRPALLAAFLCTANRATCRGRHLLQTIAYHARLPTQPVRLRTGEAASLCACAQAISDQ